MKKLKPSFTAHRLPLTLSYLALVSLLTGCNITTEADDKPFTLSIFHINDHHSHLNSTTTKLTLDNTSTQVEMGSFPRVTALINSLAQTQPHPLKLHAGDAITGDLYYTLFQGEADAALMNTVCFDAMVVGNHEFDNGDAGLKNFIDFLHNDTCQTPVLGANVVPETGVSPLAPSSDDNYLQPYFIKQYGDQKVGVIGIGTGVKTKNSSSPDATTQFLDEATTAQKYIDQLQSEGINKIVLLSHYGYNEDQEMAAKLSGVDVIIDGDSHTLLGSGFKDVGLNPAGEYPAQMTDSDGNKVCIAQAWQYADVVGELEVNFDSKGIVESCSGTLHLLLGDSFSQKNNSGDYVALTGDELTKVIDEVNNNPLLSIVTPDSAAQNLLDNYAAQVNEKMSAVIGNAAEDLCFVRIPGDTRSAICDAGVTSSHGSDISNLVAQAFLEMSTDAQIAIQNAGGVREDVATGDITIGKAYTLLPFANTLTNLTMTGAEIRKVLNEAVDYAFNPDGSTGSYPYAAGLRFDVDKSNAEGERLFNIETKVKGTTDWVPLDDSKTYIVVSNSYTAQGKDNYLTFGAVSDDGRALNTYLDYAEAFVDYVKQQNNLYKPAAEDYSTQHFYDETGALQ